MRRNLLFTILFAVTAAWAGAQHGPNADKRLEMLAKNRTTLGLLIEYGLELGDANEPVGRVNGSRQSAEAVHLALAEAAGSQDIDRVVELGEHLARLYREGLVKTLDAATQEVPEGSPSMADLKVARERAAGNATAAAGLPLDGGKLAGSDRVKYMSQKLKAAAAQVKAAAEPKK